MKRYLIFGGGCLEAEGGMDDFIGQSDSLPVAYRRAAKNHWAEILDTQKGEVHRKIKQSIGVTWPVEKLKGRA